MSKLPVAVLAGWKVFEHILVHWIAVIIVSVLVGWFATEMHQNIYIPKVLRGITIQHQNVSLVYDDVRKDGVGFNPTLAIGNMQTYGKLPTEYISDRDYSKPYAPASLTAPNQKPSIIEIEDNRVDEMLHIIQAEASLHAVGEIADTVYRSMWTVVSGISFILYFVFRGMFYRPHYTPPNTKH